VNETIETDRMISLRAQLVRFEIEALGGSREDMATAGEAASEAERARLVSLTATGDEERAALAEWRRGIRVVTSIIARLEGSRA
jgi:hypothetical protein